MTGDQGFGFDLFPGKFGLLGNQEAVNIQFPVAGRAVDAVKFQFLGKRGAGQESFQGADPHLGGILKGHMVGDAGADCRDVVVGKSEAPQNLLRHAGSHPLVPEEADPTGGFGAGGAGFAHIVQQGGEGQYGGGIF